MILPAFPRNHLLESCGQRGHQQWLPENPALLDFPNISSSFLDLVQPALPSDVLFLVPYSKPLPAWPSRPFSIFLFKSSLIQQWVSKGKARVVSSGLWPAADISRLFLGTTVLSCVALCPRDGQWNGSIDLVPPSSVAFGNVSKVLLPFPTHQPNEASSWRKAEFLMEKMYVSGQLCSRFPLFCLRPLCSPPWNGKSNILLWEATEMLGSLQQLAFAN